MSDIIDLSKYDRKSIDTVKPIKAKSCRCHNLEAIEVERSLRCSSCGRWHDPFDYVLKLADRQSRLIYSIDDMNMEANALAIEVTRLKKARSKIKSEIKIANRKLQEAKAALPELTPTKALTAMKEVLEDEKNRW